MLKIENQALRDEAHEARRCTKDVEFENMQLRKKVGLIDTINTRIETLQGTESEMAMLLKK